MTPPSSVPATGLLAQVGGDLPGPGPLGPGVDPFVGLLGSAVGSFLTTFLLGAILLAVAEEYTQRTADRVAAEPLGSFLYGLVGLVLVVLVTFALAITVVGILLAIPFIVLSVLVWAAGAAVAYLAIADRLVGHESGWLKPLLLAAAINGGLTLTAVGGVVSFGVGAAGFGAILRGRLESDTPRE